MSDNSSKSTDSSAKTSGRSESDHGDNIHITTYVDIPGAGSLRSSYDVDKKTGKISDQHMKKQK